MPDKLSKRNLTTRQLLITALALAVTFILAQPEKGTAGSAKSTNSKSSYNFEGTSSALVLDQVNTFLDKYDLTITNDAMRLQNTSRMGFVLVAHRPDWTVTLFRNDDKTYVSIPYAKFREAGLTSDIITKRYDRMMIDVKISDAKFGKYPCKRAMGGDRVVEYFQLDKRAPQIEQILFAAIKVPTNGGIPLYFGKHLVGVDWITGLKEDNHKEVLKTNTIKSVTVANSIFGIPKGYRGVQAIQEVMCSKVSRAGAEDFGELFENINEKTKKHGR